MVGGRGAHLSGDDLERALQHPVLKVQPIQVLRYDFFLFIWPEENRLSLTTVKNSAMDPDQQGSACILCPGSNSHSYFILGPYPETDSPEVLKNAKTY